ncbi:unnamed protein product [Closterium sp. NIES-54]
MEGRKLVAFQCIVTVGLLVLLPLTAHADVPTAAEVAGSATLTRQQTGGAEVPFDFFAQYSELAPFPSVPHFEIFFVSLSAESKTMFRRRLSNDNDDDLGCEEDANDHSLPKPSPSPPPPSPPPPSPP